MPLSDVERSRRYREKNREKINAAKRSFYQENKDAAVLRVKEWRAANPSISNAARARYRKAHPDTQAAGIARWRAAHPEAKATYQRNRRARKAGNGGVLSKGIAEKLFALQKGKCACCGLPLGDDYHLDHIMPLALGGENSDKNIQLLRAVCNRQKNAKHPVEFMQQRGFLL